MQLKLTLTNFYSILTKNFPFNPTVKQDIFFQKIAEFITNYNNNELFVLKGYAGTGKTTVVSTIVSSVKRMQLLGMIILLSCVITRMFTLTYFVSIWCFFAAIISVLVLLIMIKLHRNTRWAGWLHHLKS